MTRIFENATDMYREAERTLYEMGVVVKGDTVQDKVVSGDEDYFYKELTGWSFVITDIETTKHLPRLNRIWAADEFEERVSGKGLNPGEAWKLRPHVWMQYLHNGKFSYTYSERLQHQLDEIVLELIKHPFSRQAILSMWDPDIDIPHLGGAARVPCSMFYQFLIREGQIDCIYVMRSCNLYLHFCDDIYLAARMLKYIANQLGVKPRHLHVYISSLHAFKKDFPEGVF